MALRTMIQLFPSRPGDLSVDFLVKLVLVFIFLFLILAIFSGLGGPGLLDRITATILDRLNPDNIFAFFAP